MKCSIFIAASLDGFIAKRDDDISWLFDPTYTLADPDEDFGFKVFLASVDAIVMGRRTFEKVLTFDAWPYADVPVIVLTTKHLNIPSNLADRVSTTSSTPQEIVTAMEDRGYTHVYVDGGITIQNFLKTRLINELTITRIPVLLGSGIPLFGPDGIEQSLRLVSSDAYPNGFVKSVYSLE